MRTVVNDSSCIFCDIVSSQDQASLVHADDRVVAFMDIQPVNTGHLLVVPRLHASQLADLDPAIGGHIFQVGMRLAAALRRSGVRCEGIDFFLADGPAAGQEVMHVHLHVIPRFVGDGFGFRFGPGYFQRPARASLDQVAADIRQALEK
jgi:diadenosine tetraphosphate (Ap4A) HIT family hydrolase